MSVKSRSEWLKNLHQESTNFHSKVETIVSNMKLDVERLEEMHHLVRKHNNDIAPTLFNTKPNVDRINLKTLSGFIETLQSTAKQLAEYENLVAEYFVNLSPKIQQDLKDQLKEAQEILESNKNH